MSPNEELPDIIPERWARLFSMPETLREDWPQFLGLNLHNYISEVEDDDASGKRILQLKIDGDGRALLETQKASITGTLHVVPGVSDEEVEQSEPDIQITHNENDPT